MVKISIIMKSQETEQFYQLNHGLTYHYPQITSGVDRFNWIVSTNRTPYLELKIEGPWKEMLAEARSVDDMYVPHRGSYDHGGWSSLCIHGLGATLTDAAGGYPEYRDIPDDKLNYHWTEVADLCPITADYFKTKFPYQRYLRVRFMRLAPGGFISPHHDSTSFNLTAVNISLNNHMGCEMVQEGVGVVPFRDEGSAFLFNNSYEHIVWNQSTEFRYHIIVHGTYGMKWPALVNMSYKT